MSQEGIRKIAESLGWNSQEKKFFSSLVRLAQAPCEDTRKNEIKELEKIKNRKRALILPDQYQYFSNWSLPVLRELVSLKNFVSNLTWIVRKLRPSITQEQVLKALNTLERLGLIKKEKGIWKQVEEHLATIPQPDSELIFKYYEEMIHLSQTALSFPNTDREYAALTMGISSSQFEWIRKKVQAFQDEVQQELQLHADPATQVAQLNIQFFRLTND